MRKTVVLQGGRAGSGFQYVTACAPCETECACVCIPVLPDHKGK